MLVLKSIILSFKILIEFYFISLFSE